MALELTGITQLGTDYQIISASTDGSEPASVDRVEISGDGTVYGIFQNGFVKPIYKLALAKVASTDNLNPLPEICFLQRSNRVMCLWVPPILKALAAFLPVRWRSPMSIWPQS